jgi:anaerobic dimethyl sulfoxide reductase subunit B (iron-sulfur subunit)
MQLAFYFDASSCSGCKTCQVACKDKHDSPAGVRWRRVYEVCGGEWRQEGPAWVPELFAYHMSVACNHCQDPVCLQACPNKAIVKDGNGLVLIDPKRCMGCRYCEWTCPYGALQFDPDEKRMTKCSFCADYLAEGQPPACVAACPMRALGYGPLEELQQRHGKNDEVYPFPEARHTQPAVVVKSHPTESQRKKHPAHIANKEEVR